MERLYSLKEASKTLSVSRQTIQRWDKQGKIRCVRLPSGRRKVPQSEMDRIVGLKPSKRVLGIYGRVSSYDQKDDLKRQIECIKNALKSFNFPKIEVFEDIASGLSGKRKGLKRLLRLCFEGEITDIAITYPDRLTRFGYEYFNEIFNLFGVRVHILNGEGDKKSLEEELTGDLIAIITSFSGRLYGLRSHKARKLKEVVKKVLREGES